MKTVWRYSDLCNRKSTESAMLEFAGIYQFANIALVQATSPLLTGRDLDEGFALFATENTDSVLSVVRQKCFNWKINEQGGVAVIKKPAVRKCSCVRNG